MNEDFCRELRDLLRKYEADIGFAPDDCSDLYGVTGEKIVVTNQKGETLLSVDGYWLTEHDIKIGD